MYRDSILDPRADPCGDGLLICTPPTKVDVVATNTITRARKQTASRIQLLPHPKADGCTRGSSDWLTFPRRATARADQQSENQKNRRKIPDPSPPKRSSRNLGQSR